MADYKQCRECIKQDTCTFKILKSKEIDCQYFIDKDVVPKSAYEQVHAEKDNLIATYEACMKTYAEQLFEEIEYLIWQFDTRPASDLQIEIAELKKKYKGETK